MSGILGTAISYMGNYFASGISEPIVLHRGEGIQIQLATQPPKAGTVEFVDLPGVSIDSTSYYNEKFKGIRKIAKVWEEQQYDSEDANKVVGVFLFERERAKTGEKTSQMLPYLQNEYSSIKQFIAYVSIITQKSLTWGEPALIGKADQYDTVFRNSEDVQVQWNFPDAVLDGKEDPFNNEERKELQTIYCGKRISVLLDYAPIADLHFLFITNAPKRNLFELDEEDHLEAMRLKEKLIRHYAGKFQDQIVNVMLSVHSSAGQSVGRCHWHVVLTDGVGQERQGQKNSGWKMVKLLKPLSDDEIRRRVTDLKAELLTILEE
ncbi:MAG: HIT family protein [Parachlamydiales bacterium]